MIAAAANKLIMDLASTDKNFMISSRLIVIYVEFDNEAGFQEVVVTYDSHLILFV